MHLFALLACCYWTLGTPVPDDQRGPILRDAGLAITNAPLPHFTRANVDIYCADEIASVRAMSRVADDDELLPAVAELVELGRVRGGDCAVLVDDAVEATAENMWLVRHTFRAAEYWMLAGRAATTVDRQVSAFANAARFAWEMSRQLVYSAASGGAAFPLDSWITAGDAFTALARTGADAVPYAVDAYENALRASRARDLTREQAAHIAAALDALPGERAAGLRARITATAR